MARTGFGSCSRLSLDTGAVVPAAGADGGSVVSFGEAAVSFGSTVSLDGGLFKFIPNGGSVGSFGGLATLDGVGAGTVAAGCSFDYSE
jgi:hypothetical protein